MRSIRYIEVVFCKVVVKLFFLVLDFLHTNPLRKSYNSTSLLRSWAPPGFPYLKSLSIGCFIGFYRGFYRVSYKVLYRFSIWHT